MSDYEFTMGSGGVPAGSYSAEFIGAEDFEDKNGKGYGPALSLKWKILDGEHAGEIASRIAGKKLSPKSTLGKFAVALKGGQIASGEAFRLGDYIGLRGAILVEPTESGGTRVGAFIRQAPLQNQARNQAHQPEPPPVPQDLHEDGTDEIPF
jgi:hypothetical protein